MAPALAVAAKVLRQAGRAVTHKNGTMLLVAAYSIANVSGKVQIQIFVH